MEDWVQRALDRWPNVPALYGWLSLDRRGRWLIKGEVISRPQIIDTINPNYACDEQGRWYFQNGPQRGYMALEYTPLVLRTNGDGELHTHTGLPVSQADAAYLDETGALVLNTQHGAGVIAEQDLEWALDRLLQSGVTANEPQIEAALSLPTGWSTDLSFDLGGTPVPVLRLDAAELPQHLGFVRDPQPA